MGAQLRNKGEFELFQDVNIGVAPYRLALSAGFTIKKRFANEPSDEEIYDFKAISRIALRAIADRATEICVALQDLELDANRLMHIVYADENCLPFSNQVQKLKNGLQQDRKMCLKLILVVFCTC